MTSSKYVSSKRTNKTVFDLDVFKDTSNYYYVSHRLYRYITYVADILDLQPNSIQFLFDLYAEKNYISDSIVSHAFNNMYI